LQGGDAIVAGLTTWWFSFITSLIVYCSSCGSLCPAPQQFIVIGEVRRASWRSCRRHLALLPLFSNMIVAAVIVVIVMSVCLSVCLKVSAGLLTVASVDMIATELIFARNFRGT